MADTFMQNDFYSHFTRSNSSDQHTSDNSRVQSDGEEVFTDLHSCTLPVDTDSDSSHSDSSALANGNRRAPVAFSSSLKRNDLQSDGDTYDVSKKTNRRNDKSTTITGCSLESSLLESYNDIIHLIQDDPYKFIFTGISKDNNDYIRCRLVRDKSGLFQTFHLKIELENGAKSVSLLTAEKQIKIIGQSYYSISIDPHSSNNICSAELFCNNSSGTNYTLDILNGDQRQQSTIILYESNFLGLKGPRKVEVLLSKEQNDSFIHLHNKTPVWNQNGCAYVLQFDGRNRATIPSIKNFQLIVENEQSVEQMVMQFGRMSENVFSCDFRYPLSFVQAFSIGLSAFETRLFRE